MNCFLGFFVFNDLNSYFFENDSSSVSVELDTIDSQFSLAMSLFTDENYVVPMDEAHTGIQRIY